MKSEKTGRWEFDAEKVTPMVLDQEAHVTLADHYRDAVKNWGNRECFALHAQEYYHKREPVNYENRWEAMRQLEKAAGGWKLGKVL